MPDVIAVWREHHHDAHHFLVGPTEVETQILNLKLRTAREKSLCAYHQNPICKLAGDVMQNELMHINTLKSDLQHLR